MSDLKSKIEEEKQELSELFRTWVDKDLDGLDDGLGVYGMITSSFDLRLETLILKCISHGKEIQKEEEKQEEIIPKFSAF